MDDKAECILVIDDEYIVRKSLCDSLEDLGYDVLDADDGESGLEIALKEQPDLILTDLRMPSISGIEFLKKAKLLSIEAPIVVVSGAGLMTDVIEALRLGAFDYLSKPIRDPSLLEATISRALQQVRLKRENKNYQLHLEDLVEQRTASLNITNRELEWHKNNLESLVIRRTAELENLITELKDTQSQLIESAKMASLGRLVAGVSHELNTPLGICLTFISSLRDKIKSFEKNFYLGELSKKDFGKFLASAKESSEIVISNLTQASDLVKNFKMVSVDVSSEMEREFNLVDYLKKILLSLKSELYGAKVELVFDESIDFTITSYPGYFSQIFTNLIFNSIIHGFSANTLNLIKIEILINKSVVEIIYQDNGQGMSAEVKKQMYEPFFTTSRKSGGSGLGMNIIYNLVVGNLSGSIMCESEQEKGTQFLIKLPNLQSSSLV